jgi:hypothetical protein
MAPTSGAHPLVVARTSPAATRTILAAIPLQCIGTAEVDHGAAHPDSA